MKYFSVLVNFILSFVFVYSGLFTFSRPSFKFPTTYPKINIRPYVFEPHVFRSSVLAGAAEHRLFSGEFSSGSMHEGVPPRVVDYKVNGPPIWEDNLPDAHSKKNIDVEDTHLNSGLYVILILLAILVVFVYFLYKCTVKTVAKVVVPKRQKENRDPETHTDGHNEDHQTTTSL